MGYRTQTIIVKPALELPAPELVKKMGYADAEAQGTISFEEADGMTVKEGIYIGTLNNCSIIIGLDFIDDFVEPEIKGIEKTIYELNPQAEVIGIVNNEFDNSYVLSYSVNQKKERLKVGNCMKRMTDYGNELEEEKKQYKSVTIGEDGEPVYEWIMFKTTGEIGKIFESTHDQVGGELAFRMCEKVLGLNYYDIDLELEMHAFVVKDGYRNSATRTGSEKGWWTNREF